MSMAASDNTQQQPLPIQIDMGQRGVAYQPITAGFGPIRRPSFSKGSSSIARPRGSFSASTNRTSTSMPAMDGLVLLSHSSEYALSEDEEMGGDEYDEADRRRGSTSSSSKRQPKGGEQFRCEKCGKSYRHPACLTKHRWQHTEYWKEASKLMLSKHQSVQMLEAAAILVNAHALPDEKSLWPAAVSPPSSGLLGSEQLNAEVLSRVRSTSSPLAGPPLALPSVEEGKIAQDNDETSSESSSAMDQDSRIDDVDLFDFEMDAEGGSAGTSGPEDAYSNHPKSATTLKASARRRTYYGKNSITYAPPHAQFASLPPSEFASISAPQYGYFMSR